MQYATFTIEEFSKDPDFIRWVRMPTDESDRFWQTFLIENPHKSADVQAAKDYVTMLQFHEINPSGQDLARLKQRIWADIDRREEPFQRKASTGGMRWYQRPYWVAAATVSLISAVAVGWWQYQGNAHLNDLTYQTAYGKIQEIRLADGSVVTLNANSSLKVARNLANMPVREVWLVGEGYFAIAKRRGATFIVHTPEADVEVLGTEFNVNTRREQTRVVLHEGNVQLSTDNQSAVVMQPGDMATVLPKTRQIQLKRVEPDQYDAWKQSYLILDGKSLPDIINSLEDTFGVKINLSDSSLVNRKLTGKLRTDVADDCIENLGIILDVDIKKNGDTYQFD